MNSLRDSFYQSGKMVFLCTDKEWREIYRLFYGIYTLEALSLIKKWFQTVSHKIFLRFIIALITPPILTACMAQFPMNPKTTNLSHADQSNRFIRKIWSLEQWGALLLFLTSYYSKSLKTRTP
jgi:hypothetical protein